MQRGFSRAQSAEEFHLSIGIRYVFVRLLFVTPLSDETRSDGVEVRRIREGGIRQTEVQGEKTVAGEQRQGAEATRSEHRF